MSSLQDSGAFKLDCYYNHGHPDSRDLWAIPMLRNVMIIEKNREIALNPENRDGMFPDVVSFGVQPFPDIRFSKIACFLSCRVCV